MDDLPLPILLAPNVGDAEGRIDRLAALLSEPVKRWMLLARPILPSETTCNEMNSTLKFLLLSRKF